MKTSSIIKKEYITTPLGQYKVVMLSNWSAGEPMKLMVAFTGSARTNGVMYGAKRVSLISKLERLASTRWLSPAFLILNEQMNE